MISCTKGMKWQFSKESLADSYIRMSPGCQSKKISFNFFTVKASRHVYSNSFIYFCSIAEFDHLQVVPHPSSIIQFFYCILPLCDTQYFSSMCFGKISDTR